MCPLGKCWNETCTFSRLKQARLELTVIFMITFEKAQAGRKTFPWVCNYFSSLQFPKEKVLKRRLNRIFYFPFYVMQHYQRALKIIIQTGLCFLPC